MWLRLRGVGETAGDKPVASDPGGQFDTALDQVGDATMPLASVFI
jgi:hypothetical protein